NARPGRRLRRRARRLRRPRPGLADGGDRDDQRLEPDLGGVPVPAAARRIVSAHFVATPVVIPSLSRDLVSESRSRADTRSLDRLGMTTGGTAGVTMGADAGKAHGPSSAPERLRTGGVRT